jgi:hypothetical protein
MLVAHYGVRCRADRSDQRGKYPYGAGPVSAWCHRLVRGLAEHAFWLVGVVDRAPASSYAVPPNVAGLSAVLRTGPLIGPAGRGREPALGRGSARRRLPASTAGSPPTPPCRSAAACSTTPLVPLPRTVPRCSGPALRRLAGLAADGTHPLAGVPLAAVLRDERLWREIGTMARKRARTLFRFGAMLDGYQELYEKALVSRPEPVERLVGAP